MTLISKKGKINHKGVFYYYNSLCAN